MLKRKLDFKPDLIPHKIGCFDHKAVVHEIIDRDNNLKEAHRIRTWRQSRSETKKKKDAHNDKERMSEARKSQSKSKSEEQAKKDKEQS